MNSTPLLPTLLVPGLLVLGLLAGSASADPAARSRARPPLLNGVGTGTHYWIDPERGDDEALGTEGMPWKTLDRVETAELLPGDLVHVKAGVYDLGTNLRLAGITGTADAWIGLRAEGHVVLRNTAVENVVDLVGVSHLFLDGFEITHDDGDRPYEQWAPVDGIKFRDASSSDVAIMNCRIHGVGGVGIAAQVPEIRAVTVWGCEIHTASSGIYWGYYEADERRVSHDGRIAANHIHDCPPFDTDGTGYGIQIKGGSSGNVIEENLLEDVGGGERAGIAVYHASTDAGPTATRNVIRRNTVLRARHEGIYAAEGALIENNLVAHAGAVGIEIGPRDTGSRGRFYGNVTVRNNTVIEVESPTGRGIRLLDGAFAWPFVVRNNVAVVIGAEQVALRGPAEFTGTAADNHCLGAVWGDGLGVVQLTGLDCLQSVDWCDSGFGVPTPGGVLVDACDARGAPLDDLNGRFRTVPDAGAFETDAPMAR